MLRSAFLIVSLFAASSMAAPPPAQARKPSAVERDAAAAPVAQSASLEEVLTGDALVAYEAGRESFKEGDFATCHAKMKRAFELSKNVRLLRNLSTCSAKQRKYAQAIREGEMALERGGLSTEANANLRESLEFWRTFVAHATLKVTPSNAELVVDGAVLPTTEGRGSLNLDIGKHELQATAKGYLSLVKALDIHDTDAQLFDFALVEDVPETKLTVSTGPESRVAIDGAEVSLGPWTGLLKPGAHRVDVSGRDKIPYASDVQLDLGQHKTLVVDLEDKPNTWAWIAGGSVLAAGLSVGAYFLFKPDPVPADAPRGSAGSIVIP
jgi:hypothetical protein